MTWGENTKYDIFHVNDLYISAYQRKNKNVGGEVWVINRITGNYKKAAVGIYYSRRFKFDDGDEGSFAAYIFEGRCTKPQF